MKKIFLIPIIIGLGLFVTFGQVPESDSLALVALYNSTNGDSWANNTNWLQPGQPVSTWYGVTVFDDIVTEINLPSNNLVGNIPSEIGDFTGLKILFLYNNELSGPIPSTIGNLSELTNLYLRKNHLSDTIPEEIGMLINLDFLRLCDNELTGSIPEEIRNLTKLEYLLISNNGLTGTIPEGIGNLTLLEQINFSGNNLSGPIPDSIGYLNNLKYLILYNNQIDGSIPEKIGDLENLRNLMLGDNLLSGSIPSTIGNLENLEIIELFTNELTGNIPPEIGDLSKLDWLSLFENNLEGSIPPEIGNLDNLRILYLSDNLLEDSIPSEIGNLAKLESFSLYNNGISGNIPKEIGNLTNLEYLFLSNNQLCGEIPEELGALNKLVFLTLDHNRFHGPVPGEIKSFPDLTRLYLHHNNFNFFDLEPLIGHTISNFNYNSQLPVTLSTSHINVSTGDNLSFDLTEHTVYEVEATNNQYQWWKDGSSITSYSDSPVLSLTELDDGDEGIYHCTMINSDFPDLILTTDTFLLVIDGPVDIFLSSDHIDENVPANTILGTLSADDPDQSQGHSFALIEGDGINDADNSMFSISEDTLFINISPDYETQQEYSIYVRATDDDSKTFDKALVIYVNDVQESEPDAFSIQDVTKNTINVYPNPASDYIILEYETHESETISIDLVDLKGYLIQSIITNKVIQPGTHKIGIVLNEHIPSGSYILVISNNVGKQSILISKN